MEVAPRQKLLVHYLQRLHWYNDNIVQIVYIVFTTHTVFTVYTAYKLYSNCFTLLKK